MARATLQAFLSPIGEAVFPWITAPDTMHDQNGVYKTDLSVPFTEAQEFIAQLEGARNDFIKTLPLAKQKSLTPRPVYFEELTRPEYPEGATADEKKAIRDNWEGEPTGNVIFRFKLKARVQPRDGDPFEQTPVVIDAATGEDLEGPVYGGSIIQVKGQIVPYTNDAAGMVGVTLRMRAVFVVEQQQSSGGGDGDFWRTKAVA